jgi:hypothetical protein
VLLRTYQSSSSILKLLSIASVAEGKGKSSGHFVLDHHPDGRILLLQALFFVFVSLNCPNFVVFLKGLVLFNWHSGRYERVAEGAVFHLAALGYALDQLCLAFLFELKDLHQISLVA